MISKKGGIDLQILNNGGIIVTADPANGHNLIIPSLESPIVREFYEEAKRYVGKSKGMDRLYWFMNFVHDYIEDDASFGEGNKIVPLVKALRDRKGVCKEKAALLQILLALDGFSAEYVKGLVKEDDKGYGHAWVKVEINGASFLVDPTNKVFATYDYAIRNGGYKETEVLYIKPIKRE